MKLKLLFGALSAAAALTLSAAPITLGKCDFGSKPLNGGRIVGVQDIKFDAEKKVMQISREPHQNKGASGGVVIPLKRVRGLNMIIAETDISIGSAAPSGNTQTSGNLLVDIYSSRGKASAGITFSSKRYQNKRAIIFKGGEEIYNTPFAFPIDTTMRVKIFVSLPQKFWYAEIHVGSQRIFTTEQHPLPAGFTPTEMRIIASTNNVNDGAFFTASEPTITAYNKAEEKEYFEKHKINGYCSTLPRMYKNVNTKLYNAAITSFCGNNNIDRVGCGEPEVAEALASQLADLGVTTVVYNGRHFRANYLEEFDHINTVGKIVVDACKKYNINVIEHHDPTILSYRGYPFMLNRLDWLQQDIRSGESNFWFCPANDDFMSYLLGYMNKMQQKANFAGFMIDELNLASYRNCGCLSCRQAYQKETGNEVPKVINRETPTNGQRLFRTWGMRMTNLCNNIMLNELQKTAPDTIIMTYCSDYFSPNSQAVDLDEAAALYSPFVGWENMIRNPLESHTSLIGNLKTRNAYGDFYNIPIWSLNREGRSPEANYVQWAACQGTRHAIWHAGCIFSTPRHIEFFRMYGKWPEIMPHEFARTFTDTALLVSGQTWKTSGDINFFWTDFRGVMDTFVRSSRQFDSLPDGAFFYPDRLNKYDVIVLASQTSLSDTQCRNIEKFVSDGGVVIVTGNSSLYDEYGNRRINFCLGKAMNLRFMDKTMGAGKAVSTLPGTKAEFDLPHVYSVKLIDPAKSKVLVNYVKDNVSTPAVIQTNYGKGAFIYVAGQYGKYIYEREIRNGRRYNYRPLPDLASLYNAVYDHAHTIARTQAPATIKMPEKVVAIANQIQSGDMAGDIFVQIMNFTGSKVKLGEDVSTVENNEFPPVKDDLVITINRPCAGEAVLESPERKSITIKGVKQGNSTTFTIPGKELGFFAQLQVRGEIEKRMAILQPPMAEPLNTRNITPTPVPDMDEFYHPAQFKGEFVEKMPAELAAGQGFSIAADGTVKLDNQVIIAGSEFRQSVREWSMFNNTETFDVKVQKFWQNKADNAFGILESGSSSKNTVPFVREITVLGKNQLEINFAGYVRAADHGGDNNSYVFKIPVSVLKGATGKYYYGMHRSGRPPRTYTFTGNEPDGIVIDSIRHIQFTGGAIDFSIDFATMGVWGLYIEDLSSQYKAHLVKEGDYYYWVNPANSSRYGTKYFMKTILRSGVTDFAKLHSQPYNHYAYGRAVSARLQFTRGATATGYIINKNMRGFNTEFSKADMNNWSDQSAVKLIRTSNPDTDPVFYSSACGTGSNTFTIENENGLALFNISLNAAQQELKGSLQVNGGKQYSFDLAKGERKTLLIPAFTKNNKAEITFDGNWAVSAIIVQPLMSEYEDFLWKRTYFNCGKAPWLLKELKCNPADWKYFSDKHIRQAKWDF